MRAMASISSTIPPAAGIPGAETELTVQLPDGRTLGYADYGDRNGLPIIGLHGTPGSRYMFQLAGPAARALKIRLLAPERPGFGLSSFQGKRTLAGYADDIRDFADRMDLDRFAVAGVSGGGPYAAACAALLPDRVSALGLISPIGPMTRPDTSRSIGPGHYFAFRLLPRALPAIAAIFSIGRLAFLYAPSVIFGLILSRSAPSDWAILRRPEVRRNLLRGVAEGCRPGIAASVQEMRIFSKDWNVPLDRITAPSFLWQGTSDRNVPVGAALRLGALIPGCRVQRIEAAGHYWIFDHIAEVLTTIADAVKAEREPAPVADRLRANRHP